MSISSFLRRVGGRRMLEPLKGLTLWLAILAILVTLHADVFEQHTEPVVALLALPFESLERRAPPRISLSSLLPSLEEPVSTGKPLYIFALDVSKSMRLRKVTQGELEHYLEKVGSSLPTGSFNGCVAQRPDATGFDIAQLELCRYLNSVPMGSLAALWVFGDAPRLIMPRDESPEGSRYEPLRKTERGGSTKNRFYEAAGAQPADDIHSNFEALLRALEEQYREELKSQTEVHVIILSDFVHDIDGQGNEPEHDAGDESLRESHYRMSMAMIEDRFRELSRTGKTFHLSVVVGARRTVNSVLPIVNGTMDWWAYREIHMEPHRLKEDFDFLRAYQPVETTVAFPFAPGSVGAEMVDIEVDDARFVKGTLRMALASEASLPNRFPARIQVTFEGEETGLVRMGRGHVGHVPRLGETIRLQPQSRLDPREARSYRLLLSWHHDDATGSVRTYVVPIVFRKELSWFGKLSLRCVLFFVGVFLLWSLFALARMVFRAVRLGLGQHRIEETTPGSLA